jgi:hypothetical protein
MRGRVQQSPQYAWTRQLELSPKFAFGSAFLVGNAWQGHKYRAVCQVRARNDVLDPIEDNGPGGLENHLLIIRVQPPHGKASSTGETTE